MLKKNRENILGIALYHDVTEDVALDMFVANIEKGVPESGQPWYEGAKKETDYLALNKEWEALGTDGHEGAYAEYYKDVLGRKGIE